MPHYTIDKNSAAKQFLGVNAPDEDAVTASLDAAGIRHQKASDSMTGGILFDFGAGCDCEAIQRALNTVVRTPAEPKPLHPMSVRR